VPEIYHLTEYKRSISAIKFKIVILQNLHTPYTVQIYVENSKNNNKNIKKRTKTVEITVIFSGMQ